MKSTGTIRSFSPAIFAAISFLFVAPVHAQTLNIVSGNGQIAGNSAPAPQELKVQLLDANGRPFPNQIVTFNDQNGIAGRVNGTPPPTDVNGFTSAQFVGATLNTQVITSPFVQTTVIASYGNASVTFFETTSATATGGGLLIQTALQSPLQGQTIIGPAGSVSTVPIRVLVGTLTSSAGIPNVAVSIMVDTSDANAKGTLACKEGPVVLTDATGVATCTPIFGKVGNGTFTVTVGGGALVYNLNQFVVTVGPPGIITINSGDGQSGVPGQRLPLPILATVSDLALNPLSGVSVVFESVIPGAVTFTNTIATSAANGQVSTGVILGNVAGPVQIRIRDAANLIQNPAIATETVNITITGLTIVSGGGQSVFINTPFAPLIVSVRNASGAPVASQPVAFAVTSGSASLSPAVVFTDGNGNASTTVTAGPNQGAIIVTATAAGFTQTFNLTANPPGPVNFSYFNGASFEAGRISPGSIVTINAQGLVNANVQGVVGGTLVGVLPFTVAGVSVTIGNLPAPIFYVSNQNGQQSVTIQVPFEVPATTVPITISVAGGGSTSAFVTVLPVAPGLFETVTPSDNRRRVLALRPNGTVVTLANPAARGENIRVYLTGLGSVSPSVPTGTFSPAGLDPVVTSNLLVGVNNNGVPLVQAIYARNLIGVYEVTFTVPTDTVAFRSGTVNFSVAVQGPNGFVYSNPSAIVIQ